MSLLTMAAHGQEAAQLPDSAALPALVPLPMLELRLTHDDNVYRSSGNRAADTITELVPAALVDIEPLGAHLNFGYRGHYAWYASLKNENYYDHTALLEGKLGSGAHRLSIESYAARSHDDRGTDGLSGPLGPLAFWRRGFIRAQLATDVIPGRLGVETSAAYVDSRYEDTANQWRNNRGTQVHLETLYAIGPKTRWTAALNGGRITYPFSADRTTTEITYTTGLRWDATAKTSGEIQIGLQDKRVEPITADYRGTYAKVAIEWERKTYSRNRLLISRRTHESADNSAAYFVGNEARLDWRHKFNFRWSLGLDGSAQKHDYNTGRTDWYGYAGMVVEYRWRRWLKSALNADYRRRASNVVGLSYSGWAIGLGITSELL